MTPTEAVLEFRSREGLSDQNNASCSDVALFLKDRFPEAQIYGIEIWGVEPAMIGHFVVRIDGWYFDGDNPKGAKDLYDMIRSRYGHMSIFARAVRVTPEEVEQWQTAGQSPQWYQVRR